MGKIIQKTSVSQQVIDHILDHIHQGELKPGDRLPGEREFAESLGISRVPLREAISALSAIGIVEKRQGDGNFIASFSPDVLGRILHTYTMLDHALADDLFEARSLVEGASARLAARNAKPEDVQALYEAVDVMEQAVPAYIRGEKRLGDMLQLDDLFHLQCAAASHNQFYIQFVNIVHTAGTDMGLYERTYGRHPEKYYDSVEFHRQLVDAIAAGDELLAQDIMCRHIDLIRTDTEQEESLPSEGEKTGADTPA